MCHCIWKGIILKYYLGAILGFVYHRFKTLTELT
uniref:Uncharacterized protein n=1 Tax=Arundo donax TaxID=35708 RepID=A0A0A9FDV2_ARUDO